MVGARLFFFLQHPEAFHEPGDLFRTWQGGNVFYGCILGGLTGSILYWFRRPFPFLRMCDAAAPGGRHRRRGGTHRLLPERLLPRLGLRAALGRAVPGRQPCLGPPAERGAGRSPATRCRCPSIRPSSIRSLAGLLVLGLLWPTLAATGGRAR